MEKLNRIILHWTAGNYKASATDKAAYHYIVEGDGTIVEGKFKPEDNIDCKDGAYAPHSKSHNTGAIGIAIACRRNDFCQPTRKQVEVMCELAAKLCNKYKIPVGTYSVLTHAELDPKRKIDINNIPCLASYGRKNVGDDLRKKIIWYQKIKKEINE